MSDYDSMSIEELEQANQALMQQKAEIRAQQRALAQVLDQKRAVQEAEDWVKDLTQAQKQALAQIIQTQGISSQEAVGRPG